MSTDPWVVILAVIGIFLAGLLLGLIGVLGYQRWRTRRRPVERPESFPVSLEKMLVPSSRDAATKAYVDAQVAAPPRFGRPELMLYRRDEWEVPLVCNGQECPLPELAPGQAFWWIPIADEAEAGLPWCLDCVPLTAAEVEQAGVKV